MEEANHSIRSWSQWFEIPVVNMHRAKYFYETIFGIEIQVQDFGSFKMGIFPHSEVGCALCQGDDYHPSTEGPLIYLDANPDLSLILEKIEEAGGKILKEKTQISAAHGYMALIKDSEGNRMALHSDQ